VVPPSDSPSFSPSSISPSSNIQAEASASITRRAGGIDRQAAIRSALNAGAMAGVLSLLPLGFILAPPLAGFLCVLLYRRRSAAAEPSPSTGFQLGALCGAFGFVIFTLLAAANTVAFHLKAKFQAAIVEAVRHAQNTYPDPQARQSLEFFTTPQGLTVMMIFILVLICVAFVLLAGLGGAVSAALLRRKGPPA